MAPTTHSYTRLTKWTRERGNEKLSDFTDPTRLSHKNLPYIIDSKEKDLLLKLASSNPNNGSKCIPGGSNGSSWEPISPYVAIGSNWAPTNDEIVEPEYNVKIKQEEKKASTRRRNEAKILQTKNLKKEDPLLTYQLKNNDRTSLISELDVKKAVTESKIFKIDTKLASETKKKIERLKNEMNSIGAKEKRKKQSPLEISQVIQQQLQEKNARRNKEREAKQNLAAKVEQEISKLKVENQNKKQNSREYQIRYKESLDSVLKEREANRILKVEEAKRDSENIQFCCKAYEDKRLKDLCKARERKKKLLEDRKKDIVVTEKMSEEFQKMLTEEEERDFQFSKEKRKFGQKMKKRIRNKMRGHSSAPGQSETP